MGERLSRFFCVWPTTREGVSRSERLQVW